MFDQRIVLIILAILFAIAFVLCVIRMALDKSAKKSFDFVVNRSRCFVINMEKNKGRLHMFMARYYSSDMSENMRTIERFNAINGKELELKNYVTDEAFKQISQAESSGYRLRHYELTRGAVGCFMSHTTLYKKLIADDSCDFYCIFEDDAKIPDKVMDMLVTYMSHAPAGWDMIVFGSIRQVISAQNDFFNKVQSWWGLFGYVISKNGAKKFVNELARQDNKINMQIDSMMSMMCIEGKFDVYSTRKAFIGHNAEGTETDIQLPVKLAKDIDPLKYGSVAL